MNQKTKISIFSALLNARINAKRYRATNAVVTRVEGGVYKRIDENREMLELLQTQCPEFLVKHFWVENWFRSQDNFLLEVAKATQVRNPHDGRDRGRSYPRPWPVVVRELLTPAASLRECAKASVTRD